MGKGTRDDPLSDEEFAIHWITMRLKWWDALLDEEKRPKEGDWAWAGDGIGWVRRAAPKETKKR